MTMTLPELPDLARTLWGRDFVIALRERGVTGRAIGAALAEVAAHCHDSGTEPEASFGDPEEYAESLQFAGSDIDGSGQRRALLAGAASLTGLLITLRGLGGLTDSGPVLIVAGDIASVVLLVLVFLTIGLSIGWIARARLASLVAATAVFSVAFAGVTVLPILWTDGLFAMPALPLLFLGGALLIGGALAMPTSERSVITQPWDRPRELPRWVEPVGRWSLVAVAVVATAVVLLWG